MIAWSRCLPSCDIRTHRHRPEQFILPASSRVRRLELLDRPDLVRDDLPANLRDIRRLNAWTGGTSLAVRTILPLLPRSRGSLLDVATGSADIPAAVSRVAARRGTALTTTGLDSSPDVLREAEPRVRSAVQLVRGNALDLPYADDTFDVVSLCLALHHFDPPDAVRVLAEMWRVARVGIAVVDLRRNLSAYTGVWLLTHTIAPTRLTRHDGPLSVLRAYTADELRALAAHAIIPNPVIETHGPARLTLIARKEIHGR